MSEDAASATAGPAERVQSAGSEYGFPHGHIGHLNDQEQEVFQRFKLFLQEKGLYQPGPPPSHDDPTLLRFLRARRWIVEDAYKQFHETEQWRIANHLDVLYNTIDVEAYEQSRRMYPQWTGRRDKRGLPLYVFEIRHLDSKTVSNYEKQASSTYSKAHADGKTPPKLLRLFALYENLTRFVQPMCTQMTDRDNPGVPITQGTNIVDVSGVSLRQFWNLKSHMQAASTLATAHYPETLDRIFIIGAPFFFSTVWGWIKRWFDPVTVSKIYVLSHGEVQAKLRSFIDVKNIPKAYGGELEWNWGERPSLDPAIRERMSWEGSFADFPEGPLYWRNLDGDRVECISVGSIKQVERHERVGTMERFYHGELAIVPDTSSGVAAPAGQAAEADKSKDAGPGSTAPVASSPTPAGAAESTAPAEPKPAPEEGDPVITEVQGVQNLSLGDPATEVSEKVPPQEAPAQAVIA